MYKLLHFNLLFINPVLNLIYTAFNGLLTFLTYTIVPFFYPDIIASIFKCNVKYLIIVFGLGILSTLWYYQDKKMELILVSLMIFLHG